MPHCVASNDVWKNRGPLGGPTASTLASPTPPPHRGLAFLIFNFLIFNFPRRALQALSCYRPCTADNSTRLLQKQAKKAKPSKKAKKAKPSKKGAKPGGNPLQKGRSLAPKSGEMGAPPLKGEIFLA